MSQYIKDFKGLSSRDVAIAGGKGASLGEMTRAGIPIPPGFVILSGAFEKFLEETDLNVEIDAILDSVNTKEMHTVESASEKIEALILGAEIPQDIQKEINVFFKELNAVYVAVRSSATAEDSASAAWAGQLESYLNTPEEDLLENVKRCWASLFTPRAIFYRFEKELHKQKISVAVVVQKMVESEVSGVAFSVHPVTQDRNQLIIEAGFGLGEAIVSGQITPNSYVVEKEPRRIIDKNIYPQNKGLYRSKSGGNEWQEISKEKGEKQVLTDEQILELSEMVLNIEKHYNFPCDIEWAYEGGCFFITQSRPITTLKKDGYKEAKKEVPLISNYQRLFQFDGVVPFIVSYEFVYAYLDLGGLTYGNEKTWLSFMYPSAVEKTLQDGLKLYSDKNAYEAYKKDLYATYEKIKKADAIFEKGEKLTRKQVVDFIELLKYYQVLYQKAEFFYTDLAFQKSNELPEIKQNFQSFEHFKIDGRTYLNQIYFMPESHFSKFLNVLSRQFGISYDDLLNYAITELPGLFDDSKIEKDILEARKRGSVIYANGKEIVSFYGDEALNFIAEVQSQGKNLKTIKGQIANKGKVVARAKVIKVDPSEYGNLSRFIDEMEQGQVLVAETTEPAIIAACKKASAIITNQGGMMSHAAIVSREMNIPCIVGTGIATDVIQDGDLIEVDADNGVVRVLQGNSEETDKNLAHSYEQTWQAHGYAMLSMDLGVTFPFSTMKHWLCSFTDKNWFFTFENNVGSMYYSKEEMELAGYWGRRDFLNDAWFKAYIANSQQLYSKTEKLFQKYTDALLAEATKENLYEIVREMGLLLTDIYGYFNTCQPQCVALLESDLEQEIGKSAPKEKVREIMLELTRPEERTFLDEEEIEWLTVCSKEKAKDIEGALEKHSQKYGVLGTADGGNYYDAQYYKNIFEKRDIVESKEKLKKKLSQEKTIKKQKAQVVKEYKISKQAQKLGNILAVTGHERFELRLRGWMPLDYWFNGKLLPHLEKAFGIKTRLSRQLTFQELLEFLLSGNYNNGELGQRDDYFAIGMQGGKIFLGSGERGREYAKSLLPKLSEHQGEIKGQVAKTGFVKGRAYVLHWDAKDVVKEMENMPKGSILVAGQTRPQLMPAIRKAAAIVTDEGGITSHAAIVSRELEIPCVIGTKIATKTIKTGDLVEVDANNGIVKIIK
ncbi:MAG: hypothetical protein EXS48_02730 [Candidatus Staskawiczbacteria bacterium]|nr:hypothetical protein [Candidatus Staskawiczbacteria bacterium]